MWIYLYLFLSIVTFAVWGFDKTSARLGRWRVSERTLLALSWSGGAFGALAGMLFFHHKTRKPAFWLSVGAACLLHLGLLSLLTFYWKL